MNNFNDIFDNEDFLNLDDLSEAIGKRGFEYFDTNEEECEEPRELDFQ